MLFFFFIVIEVVCIGLEVWGECVDVLILLVFVVVDLLGFVGWLY